MNENEGPAFFYDAVSKIQQELKAPKNQFNKFGGYKYRSCEDILEALKQHLDGLAIVLDDEIVQVGDRYYLKAVATISDGNHSLSATAWAREPLSQKGMSDPQVTGSASSYARKYALNGLFCIDDTKDPDTQDNTANKPAPQKQSGNNPMISDGQKKAIYAITTKTLGLEFTESMKNRANQLTLKQASNLIEHLNEHKQWPEELK